MYIGVYDQDIFYRPEKFIPSIELMKIAGYHKSQRDIVELVYSFDDTEKFDILYVSRDNLSAKDFPKQAFLQDNVEWVGVGFTGEYVKLKPEIEAAKPDKSIYTQFILANWETFGRDQQTLLKRTILDPDAVLVRITHKQDLLTDYTTINCHDTRVFFWDYNFFLSPYAHDIIEYFTERNCYLQFLFTSEIKDIELMKYVCDKVHWGRWKIPIYCYTYEPTQSYDDLIALEPYFIDIHSGIYVASDKLADKKTFVKLANAFFYYISRGKQVKIVPDKVGLGKKEKTFEYQLMTMLGDFTWYTSKNQYSNMWQRVQKRNKGLYKQMLEAVKTDHELANLFSAIPKEVYQRGIWNYGLFHGAKRD